MFEIAIAGGLFGNVSRTHTEFTATIEPIASNIYEIPHHSSIPELH